MLHLRHKQLKARVEKWQWRKGRYGTEAMVLIDSISEDKRVCHSHGDFTKIISQLFSGEQLKGDHCANISITITTKTSLQSNFKAKQNKFSDSGFQASGAETPDCLLWIKP